jgi:ParB family chromosome partitioning protein
MSNRPGGLGRGLAALIPAGSGPGLIDVPISAVSPNPRQPRGAFDPDDLQELAASIADVGLLQPIVVRPLGDERYELVAGERRLRASKLAGLTRIPAIVRDTKEGDRLKEALIENIHRVDLNPLEEAAAYRQLLDDFGITQDELSQRIGKSRPTISNSLRLLSLPPAVQRRVAAGVLSAGHAKAVLALESRDAQERLAERVVAEGLSVRATEEAARLALLEDDDAPPARARAGRAPRRLNAPGLQELEDTLSDALQARVRISMGAHRGRVQIDFASVDDLERLVGALTRGLGGAEPDPALGEVTS